MKREEIEAQGHEVALRRVDTPHGPRSVVTIRRGRTSSPWVAVETTLDSVVDEAPEDTLTALHASINAPVPAEPEPSEPVDRVAVLEAKLAALEARVVELEKRPGNQPLPGGGHGNTR